MTVRPQVRALPGYDFTPHSAPVKLDQNELPYDVPAQLREELAGRLAAVAFNRYPDMQARRLVARLAELHDWPAAGIVVTPGSNVLIRCLTIAAGLGRTVLTPSPTFSIYGQQAKLLDARLVEVPLLDGFGLPLEAMLAEMRGAAGVLFLANPAAPTGNLHPLPELERLAQAAGDDWLLVFDEAYCQFAGSDASGLARAHPNVLVLRTLSKAFGLAGARLGYSLCSPELAAEIRKTVVPFCVSDVQQEIALTLLDHPELTARRLAAVVSERERLQEQLSGLEGVEPFPSVANFILFRVLAAERVHRKLLERGIVVRLQSHPSLQGCLRVSVGTPAENDAFIGAMKEILEEVKGVQEG